MMRELWRSVVLFVVLITVMLVSYQVLRTALLKNSQEIGTALTEDCVSEEQNNLTVYETLLAYGTDTLKSHRESGSSAAEIESWAHTYFQSVLEVLGEEVDPYGVINGKIVAANPWEGDAGYDFSRTEWYRQAMEAAGTVIFTDVYMDAVYNREVITIAQQCRGSDDVLAFDIFPENFLFTLQSLELPEGASLFLCDGNGTLMYRQTDMNYSDAEMQTYVHRLLEEIQRGEHERYDASILDLDGAQRGVYYSYMSNDWIAVVTIPYTSILADLEILTIGFAIVFAILLLIFGLMSWRDMRVRRRMERTNETVRVLGNSYYALYRVDVAKGSYEMIKGSDYIRGHIGPTGDYTELLNVMGDVIEEETRDEYMQSFSLESIRGLVERRVRNFGGDFLRRFGEEYRWVNIRVLFDESLQPEEVVLCFREVDQEKRRQLQERRLLEDSLKTARQNEQSKQAFFSNMSHDMRTPLNAIIGLTELASRTVADPQKTADYLKKIDRSSRQLLELINEILDMSRMEQGKLVLNNRRFDLKKCMEECADSFRYQAERENKEFAVAIDVRDALVMGDPFRLNQILNNLLSNAFKFTSPGDSVSLSVTQAEGRDYAAYTLVVADTGIGMSEEFLKKIYEPYARESRFGTQQVAGTGLGMAIVKSLVDQMDGQISVKSAPGEGSAFTVILPLMAVRGENEPEQEKASGRSAPFSLEGLHILLAEDNAVNMEITTEMLTMNGIEVTQAWNGREVLERFKAAPPYFFDAILMDMQMPEMDGCEAAEHIRHLHRPDAAGVPIIAVTANAFAEDIAATAKAGMDAHVSKPIDFRILYRTLEQLVKKEEPGGSE